MSPFVLRAIGCVTAAGCFAACSGGGTRPPEPPPPATRSWQLGMATLPPVPTVEAVLAGIELWSPHAELAAFHEELPWTDLLAGMSPAAILARDKVALVAHLRSKGLGIAFTADLTDGLSRADEAPQLRALGRSLAEPAVQQLARDYVLAVDQLLQPELLGLAAETNLVRVAAPTWLYDAVVATSNAMAADLAASSSQAQLFFSVQVETAWGWGTGGNFVGIATDLQDFPFAQALGLSSYPYFMHASPDAMPDDYFRRLADATSLPVLVTEGGWSSAAVGIGNSSPALQASWVQRQAELLDSVQAIAWLHLVYADLDLGAFPPPIPPNLLYFVAVGFAASDFTAKPAWAEWQQLAARPLQR